MDRIAVIVDAGYLFAQGSTLLTGRKQPRSACSLRVDAVVACLKQLARDKTDGLPLLRIYWYDGASVARGLSADQGRLAGTDEVKLRLGFLNNQGEQKGVDSLIVTDLVDLARNRAVSDVLLLSGDEDIRIGVSVAQSFGVRVHLLGIAPSRGSQSVQLIQEADTCSEWNVDTVVRFLPVSLESQVQSARITECRRHHDLERIALDMVGSLKVQQIDSIQSMIQSDGRVPHEYDRELLVRCREQFGRDLTSSEKQHLRTHFQDFIKLRTQSPAVKDIEAPRYAA